MPSLSTIGRRIFGFSVKGVEANRAPLPKGMLMGGGGSGMSGDYFSDLMDAIRGVDVRRSKINFRAEAGDIRSNSIVSICLSWIGTTWPQAPVRIGQVKNGETAPLPNSEAHPLVRLLRRPNPSYNGKWMTWALNTDYWAAGDGYCHMVTNGRNNLTGDVVELEWLPAAYMEPKPDSSGRLDYFEYNPGGTRREFDPKEIVHFRFGIDPRNPLKGLSPLLAQDRFIVADNCGAEYSAGLLLHGGLPPAILVPDSPPAGNGAAPARPINREQAEELTEKLTEGFRDEPGKVRFISNAVKLLTLGYKPSEMTLNELMEAPETRIPAAFGIPPEVLKLLVGLKRSTSNNIGESRKAGWQDCLAPTQDTFGEEWTESALIPRFGGKENEVIYYDRSKVGVLQPDVSALRTDAANLFDKGVISRADGKQMIGNKPSPGDEDIYATGGTEATEEDATDETDDKTDVKKKTKQRQVKKADSGNAAMQQSLKEVADRFRSDLKNRETGAVAEMNAAYDAAQTSIETALNVLVERMAQAESAGENISPAWLMQEARYRELLDQIEGELGDLADKQTGPLTDAQRDFVTTAATESRALAEAAAGTKPEGVSFTWNKLPTQAIEALIGHCSDGSPLRDLLDEMGPDASPAVRNALIGGLAMGEGADKLAARVRAVVGGDGKPGLTRTRANNIVRTEIHRAARAATIQSYRDNAHIMDGVWIWLSAADSRTCSCCWAMHGTEHPLTETLDGHCQCRCVAVPKTKSWADLVGDDSIPDTRPKIDLGEELFADLPTDVQKQILGPALYEHYVSGAVSLSDTVTQTSDARWGTMRREATVAEALNNAGNNTQNQ